MKKVAILQSNYIPWKGYFDLIASVDEFIIYDDAQFTKNDWRNRNRIKTPIGLQWLSVPVGSNINRRIRDVEITDHSWSNKHWKSFQANYARAEYFEEISDLLRDIYTNKKYEKLSVLNFDLINTICDYLGINTSLSNSWDYEVRGDKTEKLVSLCLQAGAAEYISGPSAKNYIDSEKFADKGIKLTWFDYSEYPMYPQLWGEFIHEVSIVDLLFNCGAESPQFMKHVTS
jgi:hypothetical protein